MFLSADSGSGLKRTASAMLRWIHGAVAAREPGARFCVAVWFQMRA
jgi:hypothetical protein